VVTTGFGAGFGDVIVDLKGRFRGADGAAVIMIFGEVAQEAPLGCKNGKVGLDWRDERAVADSRMVVSLALARA
jgi:hypothetical protein